MRVINLFFILLFMVSCSMSGEYKEITTYMDCEGDPDILLIGQSNASTGQAVHIESVTGREVAQINHGGQRIASWLGPTNTWLAMDMEFLNGREPDYIIWFQGESDWNSPEGYEEYFTVIMENINPHNVPVFVANVHREDPEKDTSVVRRIQQELCAGNANWYLIETIDLERKDGTHLSEIGRNGFAERVLSLIEELESDC